MLIGYFYQPNKGKFLQSLAKAFDKYYTNNKCLIDMTYTAAPVFLCAAITLAVTIVQVIFLLKVSKVQTNDPHGGMKEKKRIIVTIILMGVAFLACSACTLYQPLKVCLREGGMTVSHSDSFRALYVTGYFPFF